MTDELRNLAVNEHNKLRSQVAKGLAENKLAPDRKTPKAAKMLKMIYDCTLEASAVEHVKKCPMQRSKSDEGENDYIVYRPKKELNLLLTEAINSWFGQLKQHGSPADNLFTEKRLGQSNPTAGFAQIAWESTYKLGCGVTLCSGKGVVVCQYSPPGSVIGEIIYTIGDPCKKDDDCKCDGCKCSQDEALCIMPK
ncbi:hypothetical protein KIN20_032792 [Parelaphostrongylus tenuis]|uniref:SCP domain-containing protein n=1 Tax=Parelaphostrongylus tenuis TaxID=148309 RepID=A0AAD5N2V5_PARTN|nr:hypothetical protein KIN20_017229 [Parelaphostrongylus tenuis]KAJ1370954.1 hypothetical protein KIN20_032792 [Parelaphostrongylus tenuis]